MGLLPMLSNGLYLVDSISPSNAFHDQGNLAGFAPYDGNVDHGPYSVNSMATPSAFHLANNSTKFDPNAANVLDGLLPFNHLNDTGVAYDGGNHGIRDHGFGSQASGLTPAVDNTPSPSITSGSRVDLQGRPRPAGVDHHGRFRWACDRFGKTFGGSSDVQRHAEKHSGVLQYQCNVTGCAYPRSYCQDKLEQHKRDCH